MKIFHYLLGMYLGDGMCRKEYIRKTTGVQAYAMSLVIKESQVSLIEFLIKRYHIHVNIRKHVGVEENYYTYETRDDRVAHIIVRYCGDSSSKHFPVLSTLSSKWAILSGFLDSDGHVDGDKVRLYNTNKVLVRGICLYLTELKIEYTLVTIKTKNKPCYCVSPRAADLRRTRFNLVIPVKKERYEKLKERSKGRLINIGWEAFEKYSFIIQSNHSRGFCGRRFRNEDYRLYEKELIELKIPYDSMPL